MNQPLNHLPSAARCHPEEASPTKDLAKESRSFSSRQDPSSAKPPRDDATGVQPSVWVHLVLTIIASFLLAKSSFAENAPPRPRVEVPLAMSSPRMDTTDNDHAWTSAALIPALSMSLGKPGEGVTPLPTQVRLL